MGRSGSNRVTKVSRSRGSSQELLEHVPLPTDCSCCEITLEVVENLLEDSDEWPLRRAHAPAWSRAPHQEIGRKAVKRGEPHESSALFACQPAETLFALLGVLPIFGPPALFERDPEIATHVDCVRCRCDSAQLDAQLLHCSFSLWRRAACLLQSVFATTTRSTFLDNNISSKTGWPTSLTFQIQL